MTKLQLTTAIDSLLAAADREVRNAAACDTKFQSNSWIAHMTASVVLSALTSALIDVRDITSEESTDA